jgi:hypothetical protein
MSWLKRLMRSLYHPLGHLLFWGEASKLKETKLFVICCHVLIGASTRRIPSDLQIT